MKIVSTKHLFINSSHLKGEKNKPYDFEIVLDSTFITKQHDSQIIKITLTRFSSYVDWYSVVQDYNDKIRFTDASGSTDITLPEGNYTYRGLANILASLYPCSCAYNSINNKLIFSFNSVETTLTFLNDSYTTLGFVDNSPQASQLINGKQILASTGILKAGTGDDRIIVELRGVTPLAYNYDNYASVNGEFKPSRALCSIPLNSAPYTLLQYRDDNDEMSLYVNDRAIKRLQLSFINDDNNLLTYITNFHMVLRFDIVDKEDGNNELLNTMKDISEYNKLQFLSSALKESK